MGAYPPGTRVLVQAGDDPYTGDVGTVERTFDYDGRTVHRVRFANGDTAYYRWHELGSAV